MKKQASDMSRRQLLKTLAIGSAAGAVATVSGQALASTDNAEVTAKQADGYRETEHIRSYYDSLRSK
ncbi:twin-arginine translocation signal domain-containing protein [Shewanella avicenniae]|uniref:Twin-arginine translocation signal domain-containing protein n=1 Tax=Shewanella avicenniae TaxID=2814294 RepID=A0ABX7QRE8_9GAMM|nr:twin-arginine translocation signal domain-containing protein [Shewanella avicenniae]QSX33565.1 twin-arginine translocation signal domain-containing protein [Shewanella avicenniae]